MSDGCGQGTFHWPPLAQPSLNAVWVVWEELPRPLDCSLCPALVGEQAVATTVVGLLALRSPSYVAWTVATLVVDALYGMLRAGSWTHIFAELFEVAAPLGAHLDSPTAVVLVCWVLRIVTSVDHVVPSVVEVLLCWRVGHDKFLPQSRLVH